MIRAAPASIETRGRGAVPAPVGRLSGERRRPDASVAWFLCLGALEFGGRGAVAGDCTRLFGGAPTAPRALAGRASRP